MSKIKGAGFLLSALDKFERTIPKRIEQALRDALKPPVRTKKRRVRCKAISPKDGRACRLWRGHEGLHRPDES